ncbi:MAG: type II toxin-antitoxin system PrlF family antitoxin [Panacagrimonas sp.]
MPSPLEQLAPEIESTIGADFQTRIPDAVRKALRLSPHDVLRYRIESDGRVCLESAGRPATARPSELSPILGLVAGLMAGEPGGPAGQLQKLDPGLMSSLQALMSSATTPSRKDAKPGHETASVRDEKKET